MTARAHIRGWPIENMGHGWVYSDTKQPVKDDRPCIRCGRMPTPEGHDACLGTIPHCKSACCGHGVEQPYSMPAYREDIYIEGGVWINDCSGRADHALVRMVDSIHLFPGDGHGYEYVRTTRTWVSPVYGTIHTIFRQGRQIS